MVELEERKPSLAELLSREPPKGQEALEPLEAQQVEFLKRMRELARGLVGSEYWELVSLILVEGLEDAKGALESTTTSDKDIRVKQGEAMAYRDVFNMIVELGKKVVEEKDGEEPD